jgi:hypothetical protein
VVVPEITGWSLVVWEFAGNYTRPANASRTTEPFNATKVADEISRIGTKTAPKDPLLVNDDRDGNDSRIVRHVKSMKLFVPGSTIVADPKASAGVARRLDGKVPNSGECFGQNQFNNLVTGRYRATYRMAIEDKHQVTGMTLLYEYGTKYATPVEIQPESFKESGVYQDFSYEFNYFGRETLRVDAFFRGQGAAGALLVDKVTLELIKTYGDADIDEIKTSGTLPAELMPGTLLPDAPAEFGKAHVRVLFVAGLYSDLYSLEKAFPSDWQVTTVYAGQSETLGPYLTDYPDNINRLFQYHLVVLANVDCTALGFKNRKQLWHFTKQGGGLLVLGGMHALGQGRYRDSFLADLLPVTIASAWDVQPFETAAKLIGGKGSLLRGLDLNETGHVFMHHRVALKPNATIELYAGNEPILLISSAGNGRVAVFTGTTMGGATTPNRGFVEPKPSKPAFWNDSVWPLIASRISTWLAAPSQTLDHRPDPNRKIPISPDSITSRFICDLSGKPDGVRKYVLDGDLKTGVRRTGDTQGTPGAFLQFDLGTPYVVYKVRLASLSNFDMISAPDSNVWGQPCGPTLLRGSNDGNEWKVLATLPTAGAESQPDWFDFLTTKIGNQPFRYVQLYGGQFAISEIEVWGLPAHAKSNEQ